MSILVEHNLRELNLNSDSELVEHQLIRPKYFNTKVVNSPNWTIGILNVIHNSGKLYFMGGISDNQYAFAKYVCAQYDTVTNQVSKMFLNQGGIGGVSFKYKSKIYFAGGYIGTNAPNTNVYYIDLNTNNITLLGSLSNLTTFGEIAPSFCWRHNKSTDNLELYFGGGNESMFGTASWNKIYKLVFTPTQTNLGSLSTFCTMTQARQNFGMAFMPSSTPSNSNLDRLVIAGGVYVDTEWNETELSSIEIYNPSGVKTSSLNLPRVMSSCDVLALGTKLFLFDYQNFFISCKVNDTLTGLTTITYPSEVTQSSIRGEGQWGVDSANNPSGNFVFASGKSVYKYNIDSNTFSKLATTVNTAVTGVTIANNKLYIVTNFEGGELNSYRIESMNV